LGFGKGICFSAGTCKTLACSSVEITQEIVMRREGKTPAEKQRLAMARNDDYFQVHGP
jgi:hypothetical protein